MAYYPRAVPIAPGHSQTAFAWAAVVPGLGAGSPSQLAECPPAAAAAEIIRTPSNDKPAKEKAAP